MDKSKRKYVKALEKYNEGYIDKAIEFCEESISIDMHNSSSINLKGLMEYLKGDINSASKLWRVNSQFNRDEVSKKYLQNLDGDLKRLELYKRAVFLYNQLQINNAIHLFEECSKSDFNLINVNNYLAACYIKKCEYNRAKEALEKVFRVDIRNKMGNDSKKYLQNIGVIHKKSIHIKKVLYLFLAVIIILSSLFVFRIYNNNRFKEQKSQIKPLKKSDFNDKSLKIKEPKFSYDVMKTYMDKKNYNKLYEEIDKFKNSSLSINDKVLVSKSVKLLQGEGVEYFYRQGSDYLNKKDYKNSLLYFNRAFKYGPKSYLYPDIIYMLAYTMDISGDAENAIKYYNQYDKAYPQGSYEETVLYRLADIYKDINMDNSKYYAKKLVEKYPGSIYNNSFINSLING